MTTVPQRLSRRSQLLCATVLTVLSAAPSAHAQDAEEQDVIFVTGSRIPQDPNLISATPVQSIGADEIRLSGEFDLSEVVNDIPALISSLTSESSAQFDEIDAGANSLNLRGLGSERTLTLVNGRRHVAGFRGTQSVDIGTIPRALVESVEVTTGGASAIYGSDAVTGVVNFILKDDFDGLDLDLRGGLAGEGDAGTVAFDALWGRNTNDGRGNVTLAVTYEKDDGLLIGDRDWSRDNGIATAENNPALRFQPGDLGDDTPYFNSAFGFYGGLIPDLEDIPSGVTLTATEQAIIQRAADAPSQAVVEDPRFWLTSQEGSIAPGGFTPESRATLYVDLNNNGTPDCLESLGGLISTLAGCWVTDADGTPRVFEDGLIVTSGLVGAGGDGGRLNFNGDSIIPETERFVVNLNGNYEFTPRLTAFFEGKYVNADAKESTEDDSFYDTLAILPDNPYIPTALQPVANTAGYLLLTQDPLDWSVNNPNQYERETWRFVGALEWEIVDGHLLEFSANHGVFKNTRQESEIYLDRVFAALDATTDGEGNPVCRSDLDPDAAYSIDYFTFNNNYGNGSFESDGYYSFTPGDGQCAPLNPFGTYSASAAAQDFVTADLESVLTVKQTVYSAIASGNWGILGDAIAGPVGYAAGIEYREESSDNKLDPITLGILPEGTPFTPGVFVGDVAPWLNSYASIDNVREFNTQGAYDVLEVFGEVRLPLIQDQPLIDEFTVDAAVRAADYSTVGDISTWKLGATWAPIEDFALRATVSEAVRAPNINELFDPELPIEVDATADPCDPGNIEDGSDFREANCAADIIAAGADPDDVLDGDGNYIWVNPLTGRFTGVSGGNEDLVSETASTFTIGARITPTFVDNLTVTVDYWQIEIEEALDAIAADDILDGCVDSSTYPAVPFCEQFTRRPDGGLNFLITNTINFAKLEASGIDVAANYAFDLGPNEFGLSVVGTYQETLDRFFNPNNLSEVDPEVGEIQRPEYSGVATLSWGRGPFELGFQTNYQDRQAVDEIEDIGLYGDGAFFDETYIFDINGSVELSDRLSVYGGVNNITDEEPFATQRSWPVSPRGRFFFMGVRYQQ